MTALRIVEVNHHKTVPAIYPLFSLIGGGFALNSNGKAKDMAKVSMINLKPDCYVKLPKSRSAYF